MANPAAPLPFSSPADCCSPKHHNQTLNAVSFGFIATAVLFAMFLIMAIFERVLRPHRAFQSRNNFTDEELAEMPTPGPSDSQKPELRHVNSYSRAVSVLMPGQDYPTYFASLIPSPVAPEGVNWPSHAESSQLDATTLQRSSSKKKPLDGMDITNLSAERVTSRIGDAISVADFREKGTCLIRAVLLLGDDGDELYTAAS